MFTGIITDIGTIESREERGDTRFTLRTAYDMGTVAIGASIACSGVCLTVVEKGTGWFAVDVSAETLSRTTLGSWKSGTHVNLERALKMGDELGGHLVSGHVDGVGTISTLTKDGDSTRMTIEIPTELLPFAAEKGSFCIDGVSLTLNSVTKNSLNFNIIPHTLCATTLGKLKAGDRVNVEVDMVARYIGQLVHARS